MHVGEACCGKALVMCAARAPEVRTWFLMAACTLSVGCHDGARKSSLSLVCLYVGSFACPPRYDIPSAQRAEQPLMLCPARWVATVQACKQARLALLSWLSAESGKGCQLGALRRGSGLPLRGAFDSGSMLSDAAATVLSASLMAYSADS
jgi:hypothetical protein